MAAAQVEQKKCEGLKENMNLAQIKQEALNTKEADGCLEFEFVCLVKTEFEYAQVEKCLLTNQRPEEANEPSRDARKMLKDEKLRVLKKVKNKQDPAGKAKL